MERNDPRSRTDAYGSRINRSHSRLLANFVPWASIIIAIVLPVFPIATAMPLVPPLGLVMLLAWRLVRPGLLPVWAGVPLGLLDDLYSGQPFGFAVFTWSLVMLGIEILETRMPWRSYWQDWFTAAMVIVSYLIAGWLLSGGQPTVHSLVALFPQFVLTVLIFPIAARLVAMLDRVRLTRWKVL